MKLIAVEEINFIKSNTGSLFDITNSIGKKFGICKETSLKVQDKEVTSEQVIRFFRDHKRVVAEVEVDTNQYYLKEINFMVLE